MGYRLGGYAWSEATGGALSRLEQVKVLGLLARGKLVESFGRLALALGSGRERLHRLDVDAVPLPDSSAARRAIAHALELYTPALMNHCLRTYYFSALFAQFHQARPDHELLYVACVLHDLGLAEAHEHKMASAGFQIVGAREAYTFGTRLDWEEDRKRRLYEAISLHLNPFMPLEDAEPEPVLLQRAATLDVIGMNRHQLTPKVIASVDGSFPRAGFRDEIVHTITNKPHMHCSHAQLLGKCGFAGLARANPLDRSPYVADQRARFA